MTTTFDDDGPDIIEQAMQHCDHTGSAKPLLTRIPDKGLAWSYRASNPAQYWWICTFCKAPVAMTWERAAQYGWVEVEAL